MGLFDIFRRRSQAAPFEVVLQKAASEPVYRSEFYRRLLNEELVVLLAGEPVQTGTFVTTADTPLDLRKLPDGRIPIFTSPERIFDGGGTSERVPYASLNGEQLLRATAGSALVLNPSSRFGKELLPSEIASLLDGQLFQE